VSVRLQTIFGEMKHNPNVRRGRNRGNGKRYVPLRNQTFESNGPDGKIRGTAQQVLERYQALGRDASSSGDPVAAERYYQHAEHYFRLLHAAEAAEAERTAERIRRFGTPGGDGQGDDGPLDGQPDDRPEDGTEELIY
jgi:hypothetical protein